MTRSPARPSALTGWGLLRSRDTPGACSDLREALAVCHAVFTHPDKEHNMNKIEAAALKLTAAMDAQIEKADAESKTGERLDLVSGDYRSGAARGIRSAVYLGEEPTEDELIGRLTYQISERMTRVAELARVQLWESTRADAAVRDGNDRILAATLEVLEHASAALSAMTR